MQTERRLDGLLVKPKGGKISELPGAEGHSGNCTCAWRPCCKICVRMTFRRRTGYGSMQLQRLACSLQRYVA